MPRRKIRDEQDARNCLAAATASGLPRAQWARDHGIDGRSLNGWRVALGRRDARVEKSVTFTELVPTAPVSAKPIAVSWLRVCAGDCVVEVPTDFDDDHLRRVLKAALAC